jgi:hypothetical protein
MGVDLRTLKETGVRWAIWNVCILCKESVLAGEKSDENK